MSADGDRSVKGGWSALARPDEDSLVASARTDRVAFGVLYDRYLPMVYHYVARRVGDPATAEDITAAVWEHALSAIERYEIRGLPFAAWLYRIAGNLVVSHYRHASHVADVELGRAQDVAPEDRAEDRTMVRQALARLSHDDQELLGLCYYAGLTPPEIAEVLGCGVVAVHKRLHRARQRLRVAIEGRP